MIEITCIENFIEKDHSHSSCFVIEPLEAGQAITLGNALRRSLLSDLTGYAIHGIRLNDVKNEYASLPMLREDPLEILLNFKEVLFKESILLHERTKSLKNFLLPAFISVKGPKIVTAGMIKLPKNTLTILNPEQYICTIVKKSDFFCELDVGLGKSYQIVEEIKEFTKDDVFLPGKPKTLFLDSSYGPVQKVGFKVKLTYDTKGNLKEALYLEITTKGTKTPKRCLYEALKSLIELFYPLLANSSFLGLYSELSKNFLNFPKEFSVFSEISTEKKTSVQKKLENTNDDKKNSDFSDENSEEKSEVSPSLTKVSKKKKEEKSLETKKKEKSKKKLI